MAAIVVAAVVSLALITAGVVFLTGGDGGTDERATGTPGGADASRSVPPSEDGTDKAPSEEPGGESSQEPGDEGAATDFPAPAPSDGMPSDEPSAGSSDIALPSFLLKVGDCYDRSDKGRGAVERRDCDGAHDAEVVSRKKISGEYSSDGAVGRKADSLCRDSLRSKARKQPSGTVGGTLISFPKAKGSGSGIDYVTCSLTAGKGKKLSKPLA